MEEQICQYSKFGFCKFKDVCKRIHFNDMCKDLSHCQNITGCRKRHPKECHRFSLGNCKFKSDCEYSHQHLIKSKVKCKLTEKVDLLEKIVHELTVKQNIVETELQDKKEENKPEEKTKTDKVDDSKEQKSISEKEPIISDTKDKGADLRGEDSVTVKLKEVE